MYLKFFGFSEQPFSNTPDPKFLLLTKTHKEALTSILDGISRKKGFLVLTGDVGTGKTTICRALLNSLGNSSDTALVLNSDLSEVEILQAINRDFGLPVQSSSKFELMDSLYSLLVEHARMGRNSLIVIDDAQNLPQRTLEQVRLISNFETAKEKLVQILLVGQPELNEKLDSPKFRQVRQRIAVRPHLTTISSRETKEYIVHRLTLAGGDPGTISFSERAFRNIHRSTRGYPRLVNTLCDRALANAFMARMRVIDSDIIRRESHALRLRPRISTRLTARRKAIGWRVAASFAALVAAAVLWSWPPALSPGQRPAGPQGESWQKTIRGVEQSLSSLEMQIAGLRENHKAAAPSASRNEELEENLDSARREAENLRSRLRQKWEELETLRMNLEEIQKTKTGGETAPEVAEELSLLKQREAGLKTEMESLRNESQGKAEEITRLEKDLDILWSELARMEREKEDLVIDLQEREQLLASLDTGPEDSEIEAVVEELKIENEALKQNQQVMESIAKQTIESQGNEIERLTSVTEQLSKALKKLSLREAGSSDSSTTMLASP
jgi:type II secretory pathway predicted ATPase ExeA